MSGLGPVLAQPASRGLYPGQSRPAIIRILRIHNLVAAGQYPNVPGLAAYLEVSTRTVERDLEFLRDSLHAPLQFSHRRRGYFYSDQSFTLPQLLMSEGELLLVLLSFRLLAQFRGTPYHDRLVKALHKVTLLLSDQVTVDPNTILGEVSFHVDPLRGNEASVAGVFSVISQAIKERETLDLWYAAASTGEKSRRMVDPYHLRFVEGAWYAIAHCHLRQTVRIFALDRVEDVRPTGAHFQIPTTFSLDEFLAPSLRMEAGLPTRVAVKFDAWVARWIRERVWHDSQTIEELPDGNLILRMTVALNPGGFGEVKRWVLQYGSHAEVLEPQWLREEIRKEVTGACRLYQ
ncbi:MAG: transcriptional regulator [Bacillota bacterium]